MEGNSTIRSPLVIPILCWIIGIISAEFYQIPPAILFLFFFLFFLLSFFNKLRLLSILILIILLGSFHNSQKLPQNHIKKITQQNDSFLQPIKGRIISEVIKDKANYKFTLKLLTIKEHPVVGKINFSTFQDSLEYGDIIQTVALIRGIRKSSNPLSFDYEEYLAAKKIYAYGYPKTVIKIVGSAPKYSEQIVISIRKFLRNRIERRFGSYSGFIKAIVIGDKSEQGSWRNILNNAGLSHILAVSGLHIGIISLVAMIFLNMFFPNKNLARIVLIIFLFTYAAICSWSPSVTRASIMISFYLLSKILQRKSNTNNILLLSLFLISVFNPKQLFSIGLQMSFIAVFVLLNILPKFRFIKFSKEGFSAMKFSKKLLNGILVLMTTSLILNIFLSPLTLLYFNQFNLNGILGNILAIPVISVLLPLAILIILLPTFLIPAYQACFNILMIIFEKWAIVTGNSPLRFDFVSITFLQLIMLYLTLLLLSNWEKWKFKKIWKYTFLFIFAISFFLSANTKSGKLKITLFDCGSFGDMHLIETPENEVILIDTGPPDSFENKTLPYLQKSGIKTIDWLIITHAHNDHYGGMEFVLENLNVKNLAITDEFQTRKIWKKLLPFVQSENCSIFTICDTSHINLSNNKFKILHPDSNFSHNNINNLSIVVRLDYYDFSILFTGDIEVEGEEYLINRYSEFLDTDILKVGHHGSSTSSSIEFIDIVSPDYAFIPTSMKNRFNFPHKQTIDRFQFLENHLFIAGKDGALQITTDGKSAYLKTFLSNQEVIDNDLK